MPRVHAEDGTVERYNAFHASLIDRHSEDGKLYLYDVIDVKKKRASPVRLTPYPVKNPFLSF